MTISELAKMDAMESVDIELPIETAARLKKACRREGVPFPAGLSYLVNKAVRADGGSPE